VRNPVTGLWIPADAAVQDYDTGGGTVLQTMFGIAIPGAGGPVPGGTAAAPLVVDTELPAAAALADAEANPTAPRIGANEILFNGTTWDRSRNNVQWTVLASAARNVATVTPIQANYNASGVQVQILITAFPAAETLTVSFHSDDSVGNASYGHQQIVCVAAQVYTLTLHPGATTVPIFANNLSYGNVVPRRWHLYCVPSVTGLGHDWTFGIEGSYVA